MNGNKLIIDHIFAATEPFGDKCRCCPSLRSQHRDKPDAFHEADSFQVTTPGPGGITTQLFTINRLHVLVPPEICGEDFENIMEGPILLPLYPGIEVSCDDVEEAADTESKEGGYEDIAAFLNKVLKIGKPQDVHAYFFYRERPPIKTRPLSLSTSPTTP